MARTYDPDAALKLENYLRGQDDFGGYCNGCRYPLVKGRKLCTTCEELPQLEMRLEA